MIALATLEDRVKYTASLLHPIISHVAESDVADAARSFYFKLLAVDKYHPTGKYSGKATLVKALGNRSAQFLGEDYSLKEVCAEVDIHSVEGNHRSFIDFPSVKKVAAVINKL